MTATATPTALFLAFEVPDSVHRYYREANHLLERELDIMPMSDRIPAHLTVKATFAVPYPEVRGIISRLDSAAARLVHPVTGYLDDLDHFNQGVVHIPVNGDNLKILINSILARFESFGLKRRQNEGECPHITISKGFPKDKFFSVKKALARLEAPRGEVTFDNLVLYRREGRVWERFHTLKLRALVA